ncbi:hypothetical protein [Azospirillum argentinense]
MTPRRSIQAPLPTRERGFPFLGSAPEPAGTAVIGPAGPARSGWMAQPGVAPMGTASLGLMPPPGYRSGHRVGIFRKRCGAPVMGVHCP